MVARSAIFSIFKASGQLSRSDQPSANQTDASNTLLPYFITISNGDQAKQTWLQLEMNGNPRSIEDGQFFYKLTWVPRKFTSTGKVTFQEDLGSVRAKVERIGRIAEQITNCN